MSTNSFRVSLALQGGGAHGAFEWGVLDRLLEDERIEIAAITAASAGAMNAICVADGLLKGGREAAKQALDRFWRGVNSASGHNLFIFGDMSLFTKAMSPFSLQNNPFYRAMEGMMLTMSPYEFNPFNLNPLKELLQQQIDFEAIRNKSPAKLFISATSVTEGRVRIFKTSEISADVISASACLPHLFQAVLIDNKPYWDGGYLGNPSLWPLIYDHTPDDILLVTINPFFRDQTPRTSGEIMDRLNEITSNASLVAELRAIRFMNRLFERDELKVAAKKKYRHLRLHGISADGCLDGLDFTSKLNTEWSFLQALRARGYEAADQWIKTHFQALGQSSSLDIEGIYLSPHPVA